MTEKQSEPMNVQKKMRKQGQAMTEYIIIVAVVALASLTVFGLFGDTIKAKMNGIIESFGGGSAGIQTQAVQAGDSKGQFKNMDQQGSGM